MWTIEWMNEFYKRVSENNYRIRTAENRILKCLANEGMDGVLKSVTSVSDLEENQEKCSGAGWSTDKKKTEPAGKFWPGSQREN